MTSDATFSGSGGCGPVTGRGSVGEDAPALIAPREFETNSGLDVLLQVQLWAAESMDAAALPQMISSMVWDVLSASGCEIRDGSSCMFAAVFHELAKAIHVTRQTQRLLQVYSKAATGVKLGGCFILSSPEEAKLAELEVRGRLPAFASDYSGHILVTGSLGRAVQAIPGLLLESLEQAGTGDPTILVLLPSTRLKGNTGVVPQLWAPLPANAENVAGAVVKASALNTMTWDMAAQPLVTVETRDLIPEPVADDINTKLRAAEPAVGRPRKVWFAGVAAVMVLAGGLLFARAGKRRPEEQPKTPVTQTSPAAVGTPASAGTAATKTNGSAVSAQHFEHRLPIVEVEKKAQVEDAHVDAKRKGDTARGTKTDESQPEGAPEKRISGGLRWSEQELNQMLGNADRDSGNGNYETAIREYHTVLRYEAKNQRALLGLARAERNLADQKRLQGRDPK